MTVCSMSIYRSSSIVPVQLFLIEDSQNNRTGKNNIAKSKSTNSLSSQIPRRGK